MTCVCVVVDVLRSLNVCIRGGKEGKGNEKRGKDW